jgi:hypothetical protein
MADDDKPLRLVLREDTIQQDVVAVLEKALERAKAGEFSDVLVWATVQKTNHYYSHWSYSLDTAKRLGLMSMALFDIQHGWSH